MDNWSALFEGTEISVIVGDDGISLGWAGGNPKTTIDDINIIREMQLRLWALINDWACTERLRGDTYCVLKKGHSPETRHKGTAEKWNDQGRAFSQTTVEWD